MAKFALFDNVFIAQLCNFLSLRVDGLYVVQLIIYKLEFKKTQNFFWKDKKVYLYIAKYMHDLVNKKILLIRKFQPLYFKSSHLSLQKIFIFSFCNIDKFYYKKISFI